MSNSILNEELLKIYDKLDVINEGYWESTMVFLIYNEKDKSLNLISKSPLFTRPEIKRGLINKCKEAINNPACNPFSEETVIRQDLRNALKGTKYTCIIYLFCVDILDRERVEFVAESNVENTKEYLLSILKKGFSK